MKKILGILSLSLLLVAACNSSQKNTPKTEEEQIRAMDSLSTELDSTKADIDKSIDEVDSLTNNL